MAPEVCRDRRVVLFQSAGVGVHDLLEGHLEQSPPAHVHHGDLKQVHRTENKMDAGCEASAVSLRVGGVPSWGLGGAPFVLSALPSVGNLER